MSKIQKIIGAALAAVTLAIGAFTLVPDLALGQAQVAYPQSSAAYTVQPVLLTNVQTAVVNTGGGFTLSRQQVTNVPVGIVCDTNAIISTSNPMTPIFQSGNITNALILWGQQSNGVVYLTFYNPGTNNLFIPTNQLVKVLVQSFSP
jgi:hypothetical protein